MEKLNRAQKCSIFGPQNLGSRVGAGPPGPPWIRTCQRFTSFVPHWPLKQCARKNLHKNTFSPNGTSDSFDVKDTRKFHYSELNAFVTVQSRGARNVNLTQCTVVHPLLVTETSWLSGNSSKNRNIYYFEVFEPRDKNQKELNMVMGVLVYAKFPPHQVTFVVSGVFQRGQLGLT